MSDAAAAQAIAQSTMTLAIARRFRQRARRLPAICRDVTEWAAGVGSADALVSDFGKSFHKVIQGSREIHANGFRSLHQYRGCLR